MAQCLNGAQGFWQTTYSSNPYEMVSACRSWSENTQSDLLCWVKWFPMNGAIFRCLTGWQHFAEQRSESITTQKHGTMAITLNGLTSTAGMWRAASSCSGLQGIKLPQSGHWGSYWHGTLLAVILLNLHCVPINDWQKMMGPQFNFCVVVRTWLAV